MFAKSPISHSQSLVTVKCTFGGGGDSKKTKLIRRHRRGGLRGKHCLFFLTWPPNAQDLQGWWLYKNHTIEKKKGGVPSPQIQSLSVNTLLTSWVT